MIAAAVLCTDPICEHGGHCPEAHYRKSHVIAAFLTGRKMDTPSLVQAVCSCGAYTSGVGSEHSTRKAHADHATAKLDAVAKELPCVACPPEVLEAAARRRAAAGST